MILIGRYGSPFTRRVAVALRHFELQYEHRPVSAWNELAEVRRCNPVGRVPALVLESDNVLFDSSAILDYIDHLVGPERALVPACEPTRHEVLRIVAAAMGALEKIVAVVYERTKRPPEKVHEPWISHNESQASSALAWLDASPGSRWLTAERFTQADVTTVAMLEFARIVNPALVPYGRYPRLDALAAHCSALPAFAQTQPTSAIDVPNPSSSR